MKSRDHLREEWRLAEMAAIQAKDRAERAKQGREILFDQLVSNMLDQAGQDSKKLSAAAAERTVRTSDVYRKYLRKMHDLRLEADLMRLAAENADRVYWSNVSSEAMHRAELRMATAA